MRGFRIVPLVVITVAVAVAVAVGAAVAVAGQGMHAAQAESPGRGAHAMGGIVAIVLVAALATLPLVALLAYLRRHPLPGRLTFGLDRRLLAWGLGVVLIVFPGGPFLFGGFRLDDPTRTPAMVAVHAMVMIGFVGYALALNRFVRWLDARLLRQTPS